MKIVKSLFFVSLLILSTYSVDAQIEWVAFDGELPSTVVIGGVETNRSLAICRCEYNGAKHPGKVVASACNIGWGGKEIIVKEFEILINKGVTELDWLKSDGPIPDNAVQAGTEKGRKLFVGRGFYENGTHPGKIFDAGKNYICNIGWGGKEITLKSFEVLVAHKPTARIERKKSDLRCSKKMKNTKSIVATYIGTISKESQINEGSSLISSNLKYQTRVTDDGRLVVEEVTDCSLCDDGRVLVFESNEIWANTNEKRDAKLDYYLKFQNDGNLCIYSEQAGFVWCSMSNDKNGHHFELTNIGHIEVVNDHGGEIWPD